MASKKIEIPEEKMPKKEKPSLWQRIWKRKWWILLGIVIVVGIVVFVRVRSRGQEVESAEIERGEVSEVLILTGEVKATEYASLRFMSSGELAWLGVKEGDHVKKGQALARLDTYSLNAAYEQAVSDLRKTQTSVDKVYDDIRDHDDDETFEMKETRTNAEVARDKAYRALTIAEENLRNATLKAPFEGMVTNIENPFSGINTVFSEGQIEVLNPETIYFEVSADQTEIIDLSIGQDVVMTLDAYPDEKYIGKVVSIGQTPKSGEVGTVYEVKVNFVDASFNGIKMGMTGDAEFVMEKKDDALYVPIDFIKSDKEGRYIYLNRPKNKVYVEVGLEGEERVEILGNVSEGEKVYD